MVCSWGQVLTLAPNSNFLYPEQQHVLANVLRSLPSMWESWTVPACWLQPGPATAAVGIWRSAPVDKSSHGRSLSLSLSLSVSLSFFLSLFFSLPPFPLK